MNLNLNKLDKNKIYKISFRKGITLNPMSWLGGLIRFFAKVKYNHVAVLFYKNNEWKLQEAIDAGVITTKYENSNAVGYYSEYQLETPKFEYEINTVLNRIDFIENKKYDYEGLLFLQLLLNLFKKWYGKGKNGDKKFYCYEAVAYVFSINDSYKILPKKFNELFEIIENGKIV